MQRKASAVWQGDLKSGKGTISTDSGTLKQTQYSFSTRFENGVGTNPEELFAAGYAACFGGAIEFVARQHKKDVKGTVVTCDTSVGPREGGGFGIAVKMHVKVPTLPKDEALALVEETHEKICPYSHATRGNIDFSLEVEGA